MKENTQFRWQTLVVIIGTILVVVFLIFYLFFSLVYPESLRKVPSFLPTGAGVLSASVQVSLPPTPNSTPTPSLTPSSSPIVNSTRESLSQSSPAPTQSPTPIAIPPPSPPIPPHFTDSFEEGLGNWKTTGDVKIIESGLEDEFVRPFHGQSVVRIGRPENEGNPLSKNSLSLQLPAGYKRFTLHYNFFTYDFAGFDSPGFSVELNGQLVLQISAGEIDKDLQSTEIEHLDSTGWREFTVPISNPTDSQQIVIHAGNDAMNLPNQTPHQSWVYIDAVSFD